MRIIKRIKQHGTYTALLVNLGLVVILIPVLTMIPGGRLIYNLTIAFLIATTVMDISRTPRLLTISIVLGAPTIAVRLAASLGDSPSSGLLFATHGLILLFMAFSAFQILRDISTRSTVTADTIRGAICAYLFIGLAWASVYELIVALQPGAMSLGGTPSVRNQEANLVYYSFVVLTTLGFGDITPLSQLARGLTWIEAVAGQLFVATTIGRLVGLQLTTMKRNPPDDDGRPAGNTTGSRDGAL